MELQRYRSFILTYNSTTQTFSTGSSGKVYVFSEGASINGTQTPGTGAGTVITVFATGSFAINDFVQFGVAGCVRLVTAVGTTTITVGAVISGTSGTYTTGTRLLNIGTANDKTASHATIYAVDSDAATPITQPLTADSNGNFEFFAATGDYDVLIQSSASVDLFIDDNITLFAITRSSSTGVVSLANATDDFAVGGATLAASAFYVDESAEQIYIGGNTSPYVLVDGSGSGSNRMLTLLNTAAHPLLTWSKGGFTCDLVSSHTSSITLTLPATTGTLVGSAGTSTITGAKTFTGGVALNTVATTSNIAFQSSSNGYFQTGLVIGDTTTPTESGSLDLSRIYATKGTAATTGNVVLTSGWGTSTVTSMDTGSTSTRMRFTITHTSGASATQTTTVTYPTAWISAPFGIAARTGGTTDAALHVIECSTTTTAATIKTGGATPGNATTIILTLFSLG